jgi:diguanylate cyclase
VAWVLNSCIRHGYDHALCYVGDELIVLLNGADAGRAGVVAQNLVKKVADMKIEYKGSPMDMDFATITAGCASTVQGSGLSMEEFFKRADEALYICKEQGRNRSLVWNDSI